MLAVVLCGTPLAKIGIRTRISHTNTNHTMHENERGSNDNKRVAVSFWSECISTHFFFRLPSFLRVSETKKMEKFVVKAVVCDKSEVRDEHASDGGHILAHAFN